ncbi:MULTISPECIES: glucuronosyltransferase [unclassified Novosphingobium]|uniref:glucuronosyltransferase n=1 Tax=unclassified Novosphingobium TaxID=2644732 RepID=UPI00086C3E29|nr:MULTISPECIES: glucuronosyltransferase [unclassified Novosphingobium]ODU68638.1 MAG: glucuronosyltransferase [Novosphingobium sp. SCN 66-18]QCI93107.1 glucuronosyltransferase [Novosphingobium sp. EMRT-2]RQW45487.1 glucuronosyltransferase [Novosphingobium sp. LASN5T]
MGIKVLAVASGGGHWEQLLRLRAAFDQFDTRYVTTDPALGWREGIEDVLSIPDSNRNGPVAALRTMWCAFALVLRHRPEVIVSTGAFPGLACLIAGRVLGRRTVWIDSIANSEELSASGRMARYFATLRVTQWQHLANPDQGLYFLGAVI